MDGDVEKGVWGEGIYRSSIQVCSPPPPPPGIIAESFDWKVMFLCFENQPDRGGGRFGAFWGVGMKGLRIADGGGW